MRVTVLGIEFLSTSPEDLIENVLMGGLVVVPSGPCLANDLKNNPDYRVAVTNADVVVPDSGGMVVLWRLIKGEAIIRISGLHLIAKLLSLDELKEPGKIFWVHPSEVQRGINETWMKSRGFKYSSDDSYVAPMYPEKDLEDEDLFFQLRTRNPRVIVISIGGGAQERLGYWLKEQYTATGLPLPAIVCTGAAIGFLSGNQVKIPRWADRIFLGWLFRCISEPRKFIPRYWSATPLAWYIFRYGRSLPPMNVLD